MGNFHLKVEITFTSEFPFAFCTFSLTFYRFLSIMLIGTFINPHISFDLGNQNLRIRRREYEKLYAKKGNS